METNWTKWESFSSPEDEFWYWEKIPPEFWYWLREKIYWVPFTLTFGYWIGIHKLYSYMKTRGKPVECNGYRIAYNVLNCWATIFIAYKVFNLMPLPNLLTSEGLYTFLCVRSVKWTIKEIFVFMKKNISKLSTLCEVKSVTHSRDLILCLWENIEDLWRMPLFLILESVSY